jgi:hypothetical protein
MRITQGLLLAIAGFLGMIALRPYFAPQTKVAADSNRFDYVNVISPVFLYNGKQGILLMDQRNGNVWFLPRNGDNMKVAYDDPAFVLHIPLEKLDQAPR